MHDNAYDQCQWCHGSGCLACAGERERHQKEAIEPIFIAKRDNEHDMSLLKQFFSREAIETAFMEGEGMQDVMVNATLARMLQAMHDEKVAKLSHRNYISIEEITSA